MTKIKDANKKLESIPESCPVSFPYLVLFRFSLTPEIVSTPSSPEEENKPFLDATVPIDATVPTTKIQIRLADGSRLIQRFNQTHR